MVDREKIREAVELLKNFEEYAEISKLDINEEALYKVSETLLTLANNVLEGKLVEPKKDEQTLKEFPYCAEHCEVIKKLGAGECENVCPLKVAKKEMSKGDNK